MPRKTPRLTIADKTLLAVAQSWHRINRKIERMLSGR
jgi:hypothetical protein